jgi:hypothetical protein
VAKTNNIYIQHAMNIGEFTVGNYKVAGYCTENNTIYEFHDFDYRFKITY